MSTSPMHRPFLVRRESPRQGLYLVKPVKKSRMFLSLRSRSFVSAHPSGFYKIAAVGAALFLVFTTC